MTVEPSTWAKYRSIFLGVKFAAGSEIFKTLRDRVHEDLDYGKLSPPIQILGRGAFGTVSLHEYEGECKVAVKELVEPTIDTDKETLDYNIELFQSELKLLKKLSHKNIVRTLGFYECKIYCFWAIFRPRGGRVLRTFLIFMHIHVLFTRTFNLDSRIWHL